MLLHLEHSPDLQSMRAVRLIMTGRFCGCDNIPVLQSEEHSPGQLSDHHNSLSPIQTVYMSLPNLTTGLPENNGIGQDKMAYSE